MHPRSTVHNVYNKYSLHLDLTCFQSVYVNKVHLLQTCLIRKEIVSDELCFIKCNKSHSKPHFLPLPNNDLRRGVKCCKYPLAGIRIILSALTIRNIFSTITIKIILLVPTIKNITQHYSLSTDNKNYSKSADNQEHFLSNKNQDC